MAEREKVKSEQQILHMVSVLPAGVRYPLFAIAPRRVPD